MREHHNWWRGHQNPQNCNKTIINPKHGNFSVGSGGDAQARKSQVGTLEGQAEARGWAELKEDDRSSLEKK